MIKGCPFILTMKILRPFVYILDYMDKTLAKQFSDSVILSLTNRLDNLSEHEIKELDKDILRNTIDVLRAYINFTDPLSSDQTAELYELAIA
jgi:hypothetical protein